MAITRQKGIVVHTMSVSGVDAAATGATSVGTTENNGMTFFPRFARIRCNAATSITLPASISIGTNATSYNDILGITALTGVLSAGQYLLLPIASTVGTSVAPNTQIFVNVTTGATGTSQTFGVAVVGDCEA